MNMNDKAVVEQNTIATATKLLAETRAQCAALGLTPKQFADLLLPEALLALMVEGLRQEEVEELFARFARDEIPAWFLQVKRHTGYCDCQREALGEHAASCARAQGAMPVVERIARPASSGPAAYDNLRDPIAITKMGTE